MFEFLAPINSRKLHYRWRKQSGLSLLELILVMAIIGVVSAVAVPTYQGYLLESRINVAIQEISSISLLLDDRMQDGDLPDSLAEAGINMDDPWENPYVYLRIDGAGLRGVGQLRKDRSLVPLNTDYDLYSVGEDGRSSKPLTSRLSYDDIVRADNGNFIGLGEDY